VKRLLHKIDTTGSADRMTGSGRRRTARTEENYTAEPSINDKNVNRVKDHRFDREYLRNELRYRKSEMINYYSCLVGRKNG